jgi:hypothetical protein
MWGMAAKEGKGRKRGEGILWRNFSQNTCCDAIGSSVLF